MVKQKEAGFIRLRSKGAYFHTLEFGNNRLVKKMMLMK